MPNMGRLSSGSNTEGTSNPTTVPDGGAVHTQNNTSDSSGNKRKNKNNESLLANDITIQHGHSSSKRRRCYKVEGNREVDDPSPTGTNADISRFTNDISPAPDSNNGSYDKDEDDEDALPTFENIPAECIGESDGLVSPKKGKAFICFVLYSVLYWCLK